MSELVKDRSLVQKVLNYRDILNYHRGQTEVFAHHDYDVFTSLNERIGKYLPDGKSKLRVLDIGCGQRYPNTLLFANTDRFEAVGIDADVVGPGVSKYVKMVLKNGLERSVKSAIRETLFDRAYFSTLEKAAGKKLTKRNLNIVNTDSDRLPFPDNYFDVIISNAVFEHIEDVEAAIAELVRVSKPGAVLYNVIHLYASLSGGHNLQWAYPEKHTPDDVPPWDHLRQNKYPTHIYLNKLREYDYKAFFGKHTEILEWNDGVSEGRELLSNEIRNELSRYSEDELLKRDVTAICRPIK